MTAVRHISLAAFATACACATIGIVASAGFLFFNLYYRKRRLVKMSSPNMNVLVCVGGLISSSGSFLYGMDFIFAGEMEINSIICQAKNWVLVCSFTVLFGPIFAKTWRVHRIFKHATKGRTIITDKKLFMLLGLALIVDAIILTAWQVFDPLFSRSFEVTLTSQTKTNANETTSTSFTMHECRSNYGAIWLCVVLVWKWLLLTVGLYLAWQTREITIPPMNDSATTTANIFLTVSLFCVTGMLISYLQESPDAIAIVSIVCVSSYTVAIQMTHFCPKVYFWWKKPDNVQMRVCVSSLQNRGDSLSRQKGNDVLSIIKENNTLKESLSEKEEVISELQHHLNDAKEKLVQLYAEVELRPDSGFEFDISSISTFEDNSTVPLTRMNGFISHHSDAFRPFSMNEEKDHWRGDRDIEDITNNRPNLRTRIERYRVLDTERYNLSRNPSMKSSVSVRSARSLMSLAEISHLRDSIAEDLDQAQVLSRHLSEKYASLPSIHNLTEEWVLDSDTSNDELTSSIAKSYNLDENQETIAYIKTFVQKGHTLRQVLRPQNMRTSSEQSLVVKEQEEGGTSEISHSDSEIETRLPAMGVRARNFREWSRRTKLSDIRSRPRNRVSRHSSSRSSSESSQRRRPVVRQLSDSFAQGSFRSFRRPSGQVTRAPRNGEFDRLFPNLCSTSEESSGSSFCNISDTQSSQQLADLDRIFISTVEDSYGSSSNTDHAQGKFYYSDTSSNYSETQTSSNERLINNRMMMNSEHALTNLYANPGAYTVDSFV